MKFIKWFYVVIISFTAAMLLNIVLFFALNFLFAPADSDRWVAFYFGEQDGLYFVIVTLLLALLVIPFTKNMNIVIRR